MGRSFRRTWTMLAVASVIALLLLGAAAMASAQTLPRSFVDSPDSGLMLFEPA
jgi:hypothetical protein